MMPLGGESGEGDHGGGGGRRVKVWSRPLRISHWAIALATLSLLISGWLIGASAELSEAALDYHFLAAYVLVGGLLLRLYLLLAGRETDHWRDCWPARGQWPARLKLAGEVLLSYVGGGARPMPQWFGHNPLWGPLYLLWYALLALAAWSGWDRFAGGGVLPDLHSGLTRTLAVLVFAHLVAVVLHELRCEHGEISAMVNGFKWFRRRQVQEAEAAESSTEVKVRLIRP